MINLFACQSATQSKSSSYDQVPVNATDESLRTIILNDEELTEYESGQFISWKCRDYSDGSNVLVELGHIELIEEQLDTEAIEGMDGKTKPLLKAILDKKLQLGFVLYEGTNKGELAFYGRRGLNHRWDWGPEGKYSFIIKPDGTGLFYDFTTAKDGSKDKADDIYKCKK
jgi:hypothetical protein